MMAYYMIMSHLPQKEYMSDNEDVENSKNEDLDDEILHTTGDNDEDINLA